ncbi:hypothetical protein OG252_14685 [Streptomyces sp. NBC_01352]|uniref:Uncharacterized protein n=1 Tax=Streptomyces plumbiresistens TaxID=511811 RepID=A0ABP7SPF2_9ACTN|nr:MULTISPECIES: hypothetical protein [unclassified Streptomyces]MCX4697302.1 hypothetical protein [Streptomyces sp. NBC_01373]
METGAGLGKPIDDRARPRGLQLLQDLTDGLCELSCTEDSESRRQFAALLGQYLGRPVDVRGVRQRDDVVALVRVALNVAGGERVLVGVVRLLEGNPAGDELDRLIDPFPAAAPETPLGPPGPLSRDDESSARAVLAKGEISASRLRDDLVGELNGLDLPTRLLPDQLFTHVLEWNTQPDGLPPAVLLLDRAARLALAPGHRAALSGWADDWARRAGLTQELERRRAARAGVASDPDIPRCLIVAVEPAQDGSGEVVVRPWLNTVPGHWNPQPGEPAVTTLGGLGSAVEQALEQGSRLWSVPPEPGAGGRVQPPPYIEFVLPYDLLNHDVAGLTHRIGDGRPLPLGLKYGVHLRSLERMRSNDVLVREQWRERWRTLREHGVTVHGWSEPDGGRLDAWQAVLAGENRHTAVVLDAPADRFALEALKAAIAEGIGLAVWDRRGVFDEERREVVTAVFAAVPTPAQIPTAIHRLRQKAASHTQGPSRLLGRHIGFFWDDPTRLVDIDPGDLAGEEAPA